MRNLIRSKERKILETLKSKTGRRGAVTDIRFPHAFSHIFAGGYAAGYYYSYLWADVLAADAIPALRRKAFSTVRPVVVPDNILTRGGSEEPMEL